MRDFAGHAIANGLGPTNVEPLWVMPLLDVHRSWGTARCAPPRMAP